MAKRTKNKPRRAEAPAVHPAKQGAAVDAQAPSPEASPKPAVPRAAPSRGHVAAPKAPRAAWPRPALRFLLLMSLAFLMRVPDLGRKSLWVDEMFDWNLVTGPWSAVNQTAHRFPLTLTKLSMSVARNAFFLRLPSAIFGLVGVAFMYLTGRRLRDRRLGLLCGAVYCVSPMFLYYTQDAHHYGVMMGMAPVVMWALLWMAEERSWRALAALAGLSFLTYQVHPAAIFVPLSALATVAVWFLLDRTLLDHALSVAARGRGVSPRAAWGAAGVGAAIVGGAALYLSRNVLQAMRADTGNELEGTPNFSLSWSFFSKLLRDYLGAFSDYGTLNLWVCLLVASLALLGWLLLVRRRNWMALYLALVFVTPWIGLSIRSTSHFFHLRYTSYIAPGLLALACAALDWIARGEDRAEGDRRPLGARYWGALAAGAAVWAVVVAPNLVHYYGGEKQNWRGAIAYLAKNAEPDAVVTSYLYCNHTSIVFYEGVLGGDKLKVEKLNEMSGGPGIALERFKRLCIEGKPVYFCSSYQRYEPPRLMEWMRANCDRVFDGPTMHPDEFNHEGKNVEVYKFRHPGRFLAPSAPLEMDLGGRAGDWSDELLVDRPHTATIRVEWKNESDQPATAALLAGGKELRRWPAPPHNAGTIDVNGRLGDGLVKFAILTQGEGKVEFGRLRFETAMKEPFRLTAAAPDDYLPSFFNKEIRMDERDTITMRRCSYVGYDIWLPNGGERYLALESRNDKPGPVLLEASLDGQGLGVLAFERNDNSWSIQGFPFSAAAGHHRLALSFINEGNVDPKLAPDDDRDASIAWIDVYGERPPGKGDNRIIVEDPVRPTAEQEANYNWHVKGTPQGWLSTELSRTRFVQDPWDKDGGLVAMFDCPAPLRRGNVKPSPMDPPDPADDHIYFSPLPIPARPGQPVYLSIDVRLEDVLNHSVNLVLRSKDKDGEWLPDAAGKLTIYKQGLTDAQFHATAAHGWRRLVCATIVPPGAAFLVPTLWIYPNGSMPSNEPGRVYCRPFKFHQGRATK